MQKTKLSFRIEKQNILRTDSNKVVANSKNYLYAAFTFSTDDWDEVKIKTAIFKNRDRVFNVILDDNNECLVPHEVLDSGTVIVSVFGGNLITVDCASFKIHESGYEEGVTPEPPTQDVYSQIINMIENIEQGDITEAQIEKAVNDYLTEHPIDAVTDTEMQSYVSQYFSEHKDELKGDKGDKGDKGEQGIQGVPGTDGRNGEDGVNGYTPVRGEDYWTTEDIAQIKSYIDSQIGGALNGTY